MFDEVGVDGKPNTYKKGDWKSYAVHSDTEIKGFFGDFRFLSNFFDSPVYFDGLCYRSSECAYQAAKIIPEHRKMFVHATSYESKNLWKDPTLDKLYTPVMWDEIKYEVMMAIVFDKFYRNKELRELLLMTENAYLEETNHWNDVVWGVDCRSGKGSNWLGQILMINRKIWQINH
jgi:ribA/ribD-fused uncharacterized protein